MSELVAEHRAEAGPGRRRGTRRPRGRWRRRARRGFLAVVVILLVVAVYYVGLVTYADRRMDRVDVLRPQGVELWDPQRQQAADSFLVVGADDAGPDTVMLVSVAEAGAPPVAVVFPAAAYVDVPACTAADGTPREPYGGAFGEVFDRDGPACLVHTVQGLTGLRVAHYVQLNLGAFPAVVDDLGGVAVCLRGAGHTLDGAGALAVLHTGSDEATDETDRILGQQRVLAAVVERILSARTVLDPTRLVPVVGSAAAALTVDRDTSLRDLRTLGNVLVGRGGQGMPLLTAPIADPDYRPAAGGASYLLLDDQQGRQLYRSLVDGTGPAVAADTLDEAEARGAGTAPSDTC